MAFMRLRRCAAAAALLLCGCRGESKRPAPPPADLDHPVIVIGVDGLEWRVMLPMLREGRLPNMRRLLEAGTFGKLETLLPTLSPAIWTSVETGKVPAKHGIPNFASMDEKTREPRLYTNNDRETKALWNIFSDSGRRVGCVGWWMTFPAEEINGTMVAQTNTEAQLSTERGRAVWKGTLVPGLEGQVYPLSSQARVMEIAAQATSGLEPLLQQVFGTFPHPHTELTERLWENTLWAFRADTIYARVTESLLAGGEPFDLLLVYLGGTVVVGHRFWRYLYPDEFTHRPTPQELENFSGIIPDYYEYADEIIGSIVEAAPQASIFIVSDHGMHAVNQRQHFTADLPPVNVNSGEHQDAPPGIIIAAGRHLKPRPLSLDGLEADEVPPLGSVLDLAPTILALKGIPAGRDMDGTILKELFEDGFLERYPPSFVASHDTAEWLAARPRQLMTSGMEEERIRQLKALGYLP